MKLPKKIRVREVGPREGFQILQETYKTEEKAALIDLLSESGLREIEVTSFVKPDKVPQMADAEALVKSIKIKPDIKYTALYLNPKGFVRAEKSGHLKNDAWISAACSDTFLEKNSNTTLDQIIKSIPEWLTVFLAANKNLHGVMLSTAFGCNYEGLISSDKMMVVVDKIMNALGSLGIPLREICLADTVGLANPISIENAILAIQSNYPDIYISLHLHDTNGLGLANALRGLQLGIDCFDSSIGGIGGCPFTKGASGNISTEDLVFMCHKMGIETDIDPIKLIEAASYLETTLGIELSTKYQRIP